MKKLVKIFAVVMVCALALTAFVACAPTPNTDYDQAKENLDKNGYTVRAAKEGDTGSESYFEMYAEQYGIDASDIEAMLYGVKGEDEESGDTVGILWLKSADAAKKAYKKLEEQMDTAKKAMKALKDLLDAMPAGDDKDEAKKEYEAAKEILDNMVIGRSGNVVYQGTKAGIKATK